MPTMLPEGKSNGRRDSLGARFVTHLGVVFKFALVVSVLLLAALVQVTEQIHFSAPHYAPHQMAVMLHAQR